MVRQFLKSLAANKLDGWTLFASCEPNAPEVHSMIESVNFMPKVWWVNGTRLGPELNTFTVCFNAMNQGAHAQLYLDDDMLLSVDALDLCEWYLQQPHSRDTEINGGLCLCTDESDPARPDSITPHDTWRGLVGQGYFYTRAQWLDFVKPNFWQDNPAWGGHGYDWALGYRAAELTKRILRPRLSRTRHMGIHGHHPPGKIFPEHISQSRVSAYVIEN